MERHIFVSTAHILQERLELAVSEWVSERDTKVSITEIRWAFELFSHRFSWWIIQWNFMTGLPIWFLITHACHFWGTTSFYHTVISQQSPDVGCLWVHSHTEHQCICRCNSCWMWTCSAISVTHLSEVLRDRDKILILDKMVSLFSSPSTLPSWLAQLYQTHFWSFSHASFKHHIVTATGQGRWIFCKA